MKIKIKEAYLLILIVLGLVSLSVYSTYALFTKEVTIDNVVSFNTSISLSDSNLVEYELVTLSPNETKIIELVVSNSSTSTLYYGCWYELLTTSNDISVGLYTEKNNTPASGTLDTSATKTILLGVVNNSTSTTLVNIGVVGSTTENLGLSQNKVLVTDTYVPEILVTDEVLAANTTTTTTTETVTQEFTEAKSYEITLSKGTHTLEVWGAQGGSYSTYLGGKGGYSKGTLTLTEDTTAFVYVGGQPATVSTNRTVVPGGFNGGGNGYNRWYSSTYTYGQGGGGASDIRLGTDSLYARVIVAGGGGGSASADGTSMYGGGTTSGSSQSGYGASQTSAGTNGSFGQGGSATTSRNNYKYGSGGGGGGWYGGGAYNTADDTNTSNRQKSGGGSGYVYTSDTASNCPSGCLLNSSYYLTNAATYGGNTSFTDFNGSTVTGHSGNGAIKITGPKITTVTTYQIPRILGLKALNVKVGTSKDLESGVTYECETGSSSCTYLGSETIDTSTLELGTYTIKYKIKGANNKVYAYERTINVTNLHDPIDNSGANYPELTDALIPVVYNESTSTWVKADIEDSASTYVWYDYDQKKWANAVLVTSTNRTAYQNASAGTKIVDADILAFYVWIPRYKYMVWNINKVIGTQSYNAQTEGIDIVFEEGTSSTGTISCTYSYAAPSSTAGSPNETCTGSNGDYYTHPAFTFGDQELTGFWMGKFELSSETPSTTNGGGSSTTLTTRILPNVTSWRKNTVSNYWKVIYDMQTSDNIYGLPTSRTNADSHMLTNMEWGAVAYVTNSKYGRCTNGSCTEVTINNCENFVTGIGADKVTATKSSTTCTIDTNKYNGSKGVLASTTGNVYGVYDMNGGASEHAMGNMSKSSGTTYTYYVSSAGTNFTYSADTAKYLTTYAYGTTYDDQTAYNRGRLGEATSEIRRWYNDSTGIPTAARGPWIIRGGYNYDLSSSGIFYTNSSTGNNTNYSSRAVLSISP